MSALATVGVCFDRLILFFRVSGCGPTHPWVHERWCVTVCKEQRAKSKRSTKPGLGSKRGKPTDLRFWPRARKLLNLDSDPWYWTRIMVYGPMLHKYIDMLLSWFVGMLSGWSMDVLHARPQQGSADLLNWNSMGALKKISQKELSKGARKDSSRSEFSKCVIKENHQRCF